MDPADSWGTLGTHVVAARGSPGARESGAEVSSLAPTNVANPARRHVVLTCEQDDRGVRASGPAGPAFGPLVPPTMDGFQRTQGRVPHFGSLYFAPKDRKSTRLNSSHFLSSRMPSSA